MVDASTSGRKEARGGRPVVTVAESKLGKVLLAGY